MTVFSGFVSHDPLIYKPSLELTDSFLLLIVAKKRRHCERSEAMTMLFSLNREIKSLIIKNLEL
jgi:hypothetical protein